MHFTAVLIYACPAGEGSKLRNYSYPIVYPYFHQSWSMFVPPPKQNFNIYVRDLKHDWVDVFYEVRILHQNNRFGGNENLLLAMSSAVRFYASSADTISFVKTDHGTNVKLRVLEKIVARYLTLKNGAPPENMEIIIRIKYLDAYTDYAHYYKN